MMYSLRNRQSGFTLVELLVVIAIIGILVALLLPAVQAARDSAHRLQCQNHLKQVGLASQLHESTHGFYPSGGWGFRWMGDPDRGAGENQPGGWIYSLLPFVEEAAVHDLGAGMPAAEKRKQLTFQKSAVLSIFHCPSRRAARLYPGDELSYNADEPAAVAKSDYAANEGTRLIFGEGPTPLCLDTFPACVWRLQNRDMTDAQLKAHQREFFDGIVSVRSEVRPAEVIDGTTHTVIVSEKYLDPYRYETGDDGSDDASMYQGHDKDVSRVFKRWDQGISAFQPLPDTPGAFTGSHRFGSTHMVGFYAVMCDGSVRLVSYEIDPQAFEALGTRAGGESIQGG